MLKEEDPDTSITVGMLRRLVADQTIPSYRCGRRIMLNYDILLEYLSKPCTGPKSTQEQTGIRPVPAKLR